jgi:triosephosphate isomerase
MRKPLIAANWKMNKTVGETISFLEEFIPLVGDISDVDILIAPPFTSLLSASEKIKGKNILLSGQNIFYEDKGAYTGEISPIMLKDVGCSYVIIGHSERRQYFFETDETINKKIVAAKRNGLKVILCVGETLDERQSGKTFDILSKQIEGGLKDITLEDISIAYEPVWAIGTGRTATSEQAQEAHEFIRKKLYSIYGDIANTTRIIYGGSVTPENIKSLMDCDDVDGALVGGASLKADSFSKIVKYKISGG